MAVALMVSFSHIFALSSYSRDKQMPHVRTALLFAC